MRMLQKYTRMDLLSNIDVCAQIRLFVGNTYWITTYVHNDKFDHNAAVT